MTPPSPSPVPAGDPAHPLDTVLGDGQVHSRWFTVTHAAPSPSLAELLTDTAIVRAAITSELARYGVDLPHVGASFLLGRTSWRVLGLLTVPYLAVGAVPSLTPADVGMASLTVRAGEVGRFRLHPDRFTAVSGTAAADHAGAMLVPDAAALRDELRYRSVGLVEGLIDVLRPWARRSVANQRAVVGDSLATALWSAGRAIGDERAGVDAARACLDGTPPLPAVDLRTEEREDGPVVRRVRRTCCFAYQLDDQPLCASCPLQPGNRRRAGSGSASPHEM